MYRYCVIVTRRFVSGALRGLIHTDSVKFATWDAAEEYRVWAEAHRKIPVDAAGGSDYVVEAAILEAI